MKLPYIPAAAVTFAATLLATLFTYSASAVPPTAPTGKQWAQQFSDEFDGASINSDAWTKCYHWYYTQYDGCTNAGNNEKQWYTPGQVSTANGFAEIKAEKRDVTGVGAGNTPKQFEYVSGMLSTGGATWQAPAKQAFTYGYFEAKLKIPAGQGLWPAFWMLPTDYRWPPEIDILEVLGHDTRVAHMNSHWNDTNGSHQQDATSFVSDVALSEGWHAYAVDWQPGKLVWYIDGVARKTLTGAGVPSQPMYLLINLAVGGNWPGDPDATTQFPASVLVDYVRTYQLEDAPVVTPQPSKDTTPPVVGQYSSSATKGTWASNITVSAPVSDNVGVAKVELLIDGQVVASATNPPYSYTLTATNHSIGNHTMVVHAYDAAGNIGTSQPIHFQASASKVLWWYYNHRVRIL